MGVEIERKFLVHPHDLPKLHAGQRMIQGYLSENPSVRYRIINGVMVLAIKEYISGAERFELETPPQEISKTEIAKLCELAVVPPIIKVRYRIPDHLGLIWELDVYEGENSGLITVDVEIPSLDYPLAFPPWVDSSNDITEDKRYSNISLGRIPFSKWTQTK